MQQSYSTLHLTVTDGVAEIVLDNPPVNVISAMLMTDLGSALGDLREDHSTKVIVFSSANPDFFLAHVDMHILDDEDLLTEIADAAPEGVNVFQSVGELLRNQPQPVIVKLAGTARGGGAEFVAAADIVVAATETARLGQIESLMGIVPSGGGTQYLRERVGRNRAMEIVLTGDLYDASTAAAYGWVDRAVPAAELDEHVARVARNIADLTDGVALRTKEIFSPARPLDGYRREQAAWSRLVADPAALALMSRALESGAQTPEGESDLEHLMRSAAR
ncbi:enoyl-CoA hydratase [Brachybacterium endophyticum]|uniref:Enoyl-CoA hydratase n=1 Tax=Brachybacterium endophyticum TaxID=2182385 RepID=A0A2U2RM55_9MICO|nr:enoyl-CoA hydratase/isomerase family protein [Brachybacterium endophyticum]PWH06957.1 enoyl-CoA hydratase [Brachybacterium endophyticum]